MIFDFRFSNFDLAGPLQRGLARRDKNRRDLAGFLKQRCHSLRWQKTGIGDQLQPEAGFVGLFFDQAGFVNEILSRFRAAKCAIIRRDRGAAPNDLVGNRIGASSLRESISQLQNAQREVFCARDHFPLCHVSS